MSETQNTEITEDKDNSKSDTQQSGHVQNRDEITENNCRFDEGQPINLVRVRFPGHNKSYPFLIGKRNLMYGQKVVAMSDRGMAVGYINSFSYSLPFKKDMLPLRYISKIANQEDIEKEKEIYKKQKDAETLCQDLIEKHKLDMNLTHVEFTGFGKKVVFYFVAPARVDFRTLVKDLVGHLRLRIELRQISVRDRAASMGALGPCGRELCCSSFLSRYGNVAIKMAKNQNLTLNYSKLNGVCGQLKCCLQYEDEVYGIKRKKIPDEGKYIKAKNGDIGKVNRIHVLSEQFDLLTNKGHIKRYVSDMFDRYISQKDAKFPDRFDNISDETSQIVGLNELEAKNAKQFRRDLDKIDKKAHKYAHDTFNEVTEQNLPYEEKLQHKDKDDETSHKEELLVSAPDESVDDNHQENKNNNRPHHQHKRSKNNNKSRNKKNHRSKNNN